MLLLVYSKNPPVRSPKVRLGHPEPGQLLQGLTSLCRLGRIAHICLQCSAPWRASNTGAMSSEALPRELCLILAGDSALPLLLPQWGSPEPFTADLPSLTSKKGRDSLWQGMFFEIIIMIIFEIMIILVKFALTCL